MAGVREKEKKIEELERITFQEGGRGEKKLKICDYVEKENVNKNRS